MLNLIFPFIFVHLSSVDGLHIQPNRAMTKSIAAATISLRTNSSSSSTNSISLLTKNETSAESDSDFNSPPCISTSYLSCTKFPMRGNSNSSTSIFSSIKLDTDTNGPVKTALECATYCSTHGTIFADPNLESTTTTTSTTASPPPPQPREIRFSLRGKTGREKVRIKGSMKGTQKVKLSKEAQEFTVTLPPLSVDDVNSVEYQKFTIKFLNDRHKKPNDVRDVFLKMIEPSNSAEVSVRLPRKWKKWNCDNIKGTGKKENRRCNSVRRGKMFWGGKYVIKVKNPKYNVNHNAAATSATSLISISDKSRTPSLPSSGELVIADAGAFCACLNTNSNDPNNESNIIMESTYVRENIQDKYCREVRCEGSEDDKEGDGDYCGGSDRKSTYSLYSWGKCGAI